MGETGGSHVAGNKRVSAVLEVCHLTNGIAFSRGLGRQNGGVANSVFDHLIDAIDDAGDVAE